MEPAFRLFRKTIGVTPAKGKPVFIATKSTFGSFASSGLRPRNMAQVALPESRVGHFTNVGARDRTRSHVPNFIGIGPGKCGTTWLYNACENHPHVCVSSAKETLYFEDYHHKGMDWYLKFFRKCKCPGQSFHAIGEVSNTYIFCPAAAKRISAAFPAIKIIYNLRDPIQRAFSHYLFICRNGELSCSFEEAIERRPDLLSRGLYAKHLTPYHDHFAESKRLCLLFDDLKADPDQYAESVFGFLGVDAKMYQGDAGKRVLGASAPRSRILSRCVVAAAAITRKLGYPDLVTKVKHSGIQRLLFRPFQSGQAPEISDETRNRLKDYYLDDLDRLEAMIGRPVRTLWGY